MRHVRALPRERLVEFHAERTHTFYRCDLVDHREWGIEAQILEAPDDLRISQRFQTMGLLSAREQAIRWAAEMRKDLESGW